MLQRCERTVAGVAAAVVAIGALIVGAPGASASTATSAVIRKAYVVNCAGIRPALRPKSILIYCGDAGEFIYPVRWTNWRQPRASGTGDLYLNLCTPDCAAGHFVHEPATILLTRLARHNGKWEYGYVTIVPSAPNRYRLNTFRHSLPL